MQTGMGSESTEGGNHYMQTGLFEDTLYTSVRAIDQKKMPSNPNQASSCSISGPLKAESRRVQKDLRRLGSGVGKYEWSKIDRGRMNADL